MSLLILSQLLGDISGDDLVTLNAVRRLLQKQDSDTTQDGLLEDMITEASVMLSRELDREFVRADGVTRMFEVQRGGVVEAGDVRAVSALTVGIEGQTATALNPGDWSLRPLNARDGVYRQVYMPFYAYSFGGWRSRYGASGCGMVATVTGDFGFATVPPDVARGVKITVKTWLREGASFTPDGDVIRFERVGRIPQDVLDGLQHYRIPVV